MRLHNKQRYTYFKLLYLLFILLVLFDIVGSSLEGSLGGLQMLTPFAFLVGIFLMYRGLPVFEFDSDGEVLIIATKEPFLQPFSSIFLHQTEFPKRKLRGYAIQHWPFRRVLTVVIDSKEGGTKKVKQTMSYLSKSEVRDIERSLRGCLKKYKNQDFDEDEIE